MSATRLSRVNSAASQVCDALSNYNNRTLMYPCIPYSCTLSYALGELGMMESREMEQKPMMIGPSRLSNGRVGTSSQIGGMMRSINESSVERNKHGHESIPCPHTLSPLSLYCLGLFTRYIVTLEWAKWATDAERDLFGGGLGLALCCLYRPVGKIGNDDDTSNHIRIQEATSSQAQA